VVILSGLYQGRTTGTPISMMVENTDARPGAYAEMGRSSPVARRLHYQQKFGIRNPEGGGRSSARETIGRVAAGAVAKKILGLAAGVEIRAFVTRIHDIEMRRAPSSPRWPRSRPAPCAARMPTPPSA